MRRIEKEGTPEHLAAWMDEFRQRRGREPYYKDLIGTPEYISLKTALLEEQGYICCYCEQGIGRGAGIDCDIEHFMPRNPDKDKLTPEEIRLCEEAQLDYNNLFASCRGDDRYSLDHCNHRKENWYDFRYCVSPASPEIEELFGYRLSGKIFAEDNEEAAEEMKSHLNLDTYVLQEQRKAAYDAVLEVEFGENEELLEDDSYIQDTIEYYRRKDEEGHLVPFCSMIAYCLERYLLEH